MNLSIVRRSSSPVENDRSARLVVVWESACPALLPEVTPVASLTPVLFSTTYVVALAFWADRRPRQTVHDTPYVTAVGTLERSLRHSRLLHHRLCRRPCSRSQSRRCDTIVTHSCNPSPQPEGRRSDRRGNTLHRTPRCKQMDSLQRESALLARPAKTCSPERILTEVAGRSRRVSDSPAPPPRRS